MSGLHTHISNMSERHISEDQMEQYHMGHLRGSQLAVVEEHLLWCHHCIERSLTSERYVRAMRRAAVRIGLQELVPLSL